MNHILSAVLLMASGLAILLPAEDWPAWRGPTGMGRSSEKGLPLTWSVTETEGGEWRPAANHR